MDRERVTHHEPPVVVVEAGGGAAATFALPEGPLFDPFADPPPTYTYWTPGVSGAWRTTTRRVIFRTTITRRPFADPVPSAVAGLGESVSETNGAANAAPPALAGCPA